MDKITEGKVWKQILYFFFPLMLGMLFQQLYAMADSMIVGHFIGTQALAAVGGTAASFVNLIVGFYTGLSAGASVVISHLVGEKKTDKLSAGISTSVLIGVIGGVLFMIIGIAASEQVLVIMHTPEDIIYDSQIYLKVYFLGMIPSCVYNMGAGILRAFGEVRLPLYYLVVACVVNIVLDYIFVVPLRQGVAGAAAATAIAQAVSAVCVCIPLTNTKKPYGVSRKEISFDKTLFLRILRIGIPAGLQSIMYNAANLIVQTSINILGTETVAAWSIYSKADGIFGMIVTSFGTASMTFTGQNYGARKYQRIREGLKVSLLLCAAATLTASAGFIFFADGFFRMFTNDGDVILIGVRIMHFLASFQIVYIFAEILSGIDRGMGKAGVPLFITFGSVCVLRILWLVAVVPHWMNIIAVLLCFPITWGVSSAIFILYTKYVMKHMEKSNFT